MDAKDLRIESALGAQSNDGSTKYASNGPALQTNGSKPYHDIGSNSLAKVDVSTARPCAIIGPDRVVPPHSTNDVYLKKAPVEPWPCTDIYQQTPEYPHKPVDYPPSRNISPRQTFQENMQRIMVPPMYASVKSNEDHSLKNNKLVPSEAKYCDVPYTISPINNEPKIIKNPEGLLPNNNSAYVQPVPPQGWLGSGVNVRPIRPYGAPEFYQYSEFPNCPGPRPLSMIRTHRNIHEDVPQVYQDRFYPAANIRFKPYPSTKERHHQPPQARYEYITNYSNAFHLHNPYAPHKYDLQKSMPPHPCPVYPAMPLKYLDKRMSATPMDRYQRSPSQQINFNPPFCNQNIPPSYGSAPGNTLQSRSYPYSPDPSTKHMIQNRLYFDNNSAHKYYSNSENMYLNDINQPQTIKNDVLYPSYPPINIHSLPHMYRKENPMKGYEHSTHFRNYEYSAKINPISRLPLQFSPQTISISPDSNTSNDTIHTLSNVQEDCGYVSQSSTASVKSVESGVNRMSSDVYRNRDMRFETSHVNKSAQKLDTNPISKDKKGLNVRQFLQMWNEGDDEGTESNKETSMQLDSSNTLTHTETAVNQEQLYVLGLVTVPNEELDKYDHIQKISKLPENIKGYNSIELLNQYEKLVESSNNNHFNLTPLQPKQKDLHVSLRNTGPRQGMSMPSRPPSPLDVEAKISQSVIHKEVGCNFEIRPCSPQMMNVQVATPVHNVLSERLIEKVVNPVITKSPMINRREETISDTPSRNLGGTHVQSCKMVNTQYASPNVVESLKTSYCIQDLESNSGVGLASLPRLDNDIELTFPEINQQFINANKMEAVKMTSMPDLPILDTENSNILKNKIHSKSFIPENLNSGSESDKEVSKLSKYRKHKKSNSIHRTDSVIIKNPENLKTQEEYSNIPLINKTSDSITINPIKELQSDRDVNSSNQDFDETVINKFDNYASTQSVDTAIDFSFNKNDGHEIFINSMGNLTDSLHNTNDVIDKNLFSDSGMTELNVEKRKKFIQNSTSIALSSIELDSPTLDNFNSASTLNTNVVTIMDNHIDKQANASVYSNKTDFKSIDEDTLLLSESVIAHSISKEKLATEDFVQQKDLPILCQDDEENISKEFKSEHKHMKLSEKNDIKSHVLNNSLPDDLNHSSTSVHETNSNLTEKGDMDQDYARDVNVENGFNLENETKNTTLMCTNEVTIKSDDPKVECSDNTKEILLVKYEVKEEANIVEGNLANEIDIAIVGNNITVPIKENENNDSVNSKSYLGIEYNNKYSDKIHITLDSPNISKGDGTEIDNTKINVFDTHCNDKDNNTNTTVFDAHCNDNTNTNVIDKHCNDKDNTKINVFDKHCKHKDNTNTNVLDTHCSDKDNTNTNVFDTQCNDKDNDSNTNVFDTNCSHKGNNTDTNVFDTHCIDKDNNTNTNEFNIHCSDKDNNTITNVFDTHCSDKYNNTNTNMLDAHCSDKHNINTNVFDTHSNDKDKNTNTNVFDVHCSDKDNNTNTNVFDAHCSDKDNNTNTNVFDAHCSDKDNNKHNSVFVSKIDFDSTPWPSMVTLENNNESADKWKAKNIYININEKSDSEIIKTIGCNKSTTVNINDNAKYFQYKNEIFLKKELFSPWFQNLLLHIDGFCDPLQNSDEKCVPEINNFQGTNTFSHNNNEVVISSDKTDIRANPCDTNSSLTNDEANSIVANMDTLTDQILTEMVSEESHEPKIQERTIDIETVEIGQNEMLDIKECTDLIKNVGEDNYSELFEEQDNEDGNIKEEMENNIKMNVNLTENFKERPFLTDQISKNLLPTRSRTLKRSLSESAAEDYISARDSFRRNGVDNSMNTKRTKVDESEILVESHVIDENFTSFIQSSRRNSISTIYNDENVSFCIVIDNDCVLTEENEDCSKICYTEIPGDCLTTLCTEVEAVNSESTRVISCENTGQGEYGNEFILHNIEDRTIPETWVEDVACMETVFSDDVAEDIVISAPSSPTVFESSEDENENIESGYNGCENEHTNKVKDIYGNEMCDDDAQLVDKLYRTPQMEVNNTLIGRTSRLQSDEYNRCYDDRSLEKILSESNIVDTNSSFQNDTVLDKSFILPSDPVDDVHGNKENLKNNFLEQISNNETYCTIDFSTADQNNLEDEKKSKDCDDCLARSCESSCDAYVSYKKDEEKLHYAISSSPEVSSTTSEEKGSTILLKIRSYKGTKISEINDMSASFNQTNSTKFNSSYNVPSSRPLITKAAQKYIPPLKETIRDLKVKLRLPKQSLYKLQQLKKSKEEPKINTSCIKNYVKTAPQDHPKKSKPKFEDVLKSIDEIQFKRHKEKSKKTKQTIPKVIIKKNENGAHYASTQSKETYNPDLTGRKWQPWVFIEKNNFIDKMAVKHKFQAIYSHRKKSYVFADSFRKYKSVSNSNFVISHPEPNDNVSTGKLKYTFRLKHN